MNDEKKPVFEINDAGEAAGYLWRFLEDIIKRGTLEVDRESLFVSALAYALKCGFCGNGMQVKMTDGGDVINVLTVFPFTNPVDEQLYYCLLGECETGTAKYVVPAKDVVYINAGMNSSIERNADRYVNGGDNETDKE